MTLRGTELRARQCAISRPGSEGTIFFPLATSSSRPLQSPSPFGWLDTWRALAVKCETEKETVYLRNYFPC